MFFGLPEIEENLRLDPPLAQRVAVRCRLEPLGSDATEAYVRHRLALAGATRIPFTEGAIREVHRFSRGTPRLINTICDNALFEGFVAGSRDVDEVLVEWVARDLSLEPVPPPPERLRVPDRPVRVDLAEIDRYLDSLLD